MGDHARARDYFEQARGIGRETGRYHDRALWSLGMLSHALGDDEAALAYSQRALHLLSVRAETGMRAYFCTGLGNALVGLGCYAEGEDAYRQALDLWREQGGHDLPPEPLAGLARVALAQGDPAQALAHVEEILPILETHPALEFTWEPLRIYLTCYHVLRAIEDPRAEAILDTAYRLLQERALKIDDPALRRSYFGNVAAHREIVAAWNETNTKQET